VCAGKRKARVGVQESAIPPAIRIVALRAIVREPLRRMIGIPRAVIIRLMARITRGGRAYELPVHVALCTGHRCVPSGERKRRSGMIKGGRLPGGGVVTDGAVMRIVLARVIGIVRTGVVRRMAGITVCGRVGKLSVDMTLCALQGNMRACQREGRQIVIEGRRLPRRGGVALGAIVREIPAHVIGIGRAFKI